MTVFVLEDDPERIRWFERFFAQHHVEWQCVHTNERVDEFVGPYDVVCLDHDLGGRQLEAHEDDGLAFIRAIKDRVGDACVIIHSWNDVGARRMKAEWPAALLAEFGSPRFTGILERLMPRTWPDGSPRK